MVAAEMVLLTAMDVRGINPNKLILASLSGHRHIVRLRLLFLAWRLVDESVDNLVRPALGRE